MDQLTIMRSFVGVTKSRSFSQAARALGISGSLVSRHVAELERALGVHLVNRTARTISLTEAGTQHVPGEPEARRPAAVPRRARLREGQRPAGLTRGLAPARRATARRRGRQILASMSRLAVTPSAPRTVSRGSDSCTP